MLICHYNSENNSENKVQNKIMAERVYLFDTTLRDGAQTQGVDFTFADKTAIAAALDRLGIDYIEGGWPGANPTDTHFFNTPPDLTHARLTAFGMTRRPGRSAANDPGLAVLSNCTTPALCVVGKSWDFQVDTVLEIPRAENLTLIAETIAHLTVLPHKPEIMFDAEHFFDGYKANPNYALSCLHTALEAGACWVVLCDTNGGTLAHEVEEIVTAVTAKIPGGSVGIHCHNDTENAVANSLAAVRAGVRQVQGTLNGLGERCGNANMVALIPNLMLKMGYETGVCLEGLKQLTSLSRELDERLNRVSNPHAAYVGTAAFAHKGGLHVSAVAKDPRTYEHIAPEQIGNVRQILISDQAGRANILARFEEIGISLDSTDPKLGYLLAEVKEREHRGYAYDNAAASFELLARRFLGQIEDFYKLESFKVTGERRWNAKGELITQSDAIVKLYVDQHRIICAGEGNGPVNALDAALREALLPLFPALYPVKLLDYRVRILGASAGTGAVTRVLVDSTDGQGHLWTTIGVSTNIIEASYEALADSISYTLMRAGRVAA